MHSHTLDTWQHEHRFLGEKHDRHERRTWLVVVLTAVMMVAEILGGNIFGSMALVADGWHMSTHAAALGIAALAYRFARIYASDARLTFGTGKLGELAGFSSAIMLAMIALFIGYESATRLLQPVIIGFEQAIPIAMAGLAVNLLSAWLLHDGDHHHAHGHSDHHAHDDVHHHQELHGHHDTNQRAAYVHVLADALTSILAIIALVLGRYYGLTWLDPVMGLVGTVVILAWSWSLVRSAGSVLLDAVPSKTQARQVRGCLELDGDKVADLHLWRLGPGHLGVIASVVSDNPQAPEAYKRRLDGMHGLAHVTIEVHACAHP
ncbi:MAG: CDF family Co(II)/Ni(II) efflux transporter DmeF [Nitrobacter sp.]